MIQLTDISKYYRSNDNVAVGLHRVNLDFEAGDFVVITGESGGGKSTLLNVLSGSLAYDDGELMFEGRETSYFDEEDWENYRREKIGFIYQDYRLIDSFSALENVKMAIFILNPDTKEADAAKKAQFYLEKVGLLNQAGKRAAQLSSGQKQRLAIARALAKETKIIVADEPTGNLDVENSRQIIKLLSELSKEKLVIMVTHNYEEAQPYATRKIRMYNGEVAEDIRLRPNQRGEEKAEEAALAEALDRKKQNRLLAKKMIQKVRHAKPHNMFLLFILFWFITVSVYIFYGSFKKNLDYSVTKDYSDKTYVNNDKRRLSVRKPDMAAMTEEDMEKLQSLKYVEYVDLYDAVNDIIYVSEQSEDYVIEKKKNEEIVSVRDESKKIRSVAGLTADNLTVGELALAYNEAVVASDDKSLIGQTIPAYFYRKYIWESEWIAQELVITGITDKGDAGQLYVSEAMARQLNLAVDRLDDYTLYAMIASIGYGMSEQEFFLGEATEPGLYDFAKVARAKPIFLKNDSLSGMQAYAAENLFRCPAVVDHYSGEWVYNQLYKELYLFWGPSYDREGRMLEMQMETTQHSASVFEVSEEVYNELFTDQESHQMSVYITDYAYTDRVIAALEKEGYEAVSVFRAGSTDYNEEKMGQQTILLLISLAALIVILLAGIFLIRRIISGRGRDYSIMMLIGMKRSVIDGMNLRDILYHMGGAFLGTIVLVNLALHFNIPYAAPIIRYYEALDYLVFIVILCAMGAILYKKLMFKINSKN